MTLAPRATELGPRRSPAVRRLVLADTATRDMRGHVLAPGLEGGGAARQLVEAEAVRDVQPRDGGRRRVVARRGRRAHAPVPGEDAADPGLGRRVVEPALRVGRAEAVVLRHGPGRGGRVVAAEAHGGRDRVLPDACGGDNPPSSRGTKGTR